MSMAPRLPLWRYLLWSAMSTVLFYNFFMLSRWFLRSARRVPLSLLQGQLPEDGPKDIRVSPIFAFALAANEDIILYMLTMFGSQAGRLSMGMYPFAADIDYGRKHCEKSHDNHHVVVLFCLLLFCCTTKKRLLFLLFCTYIVSSYHHIIILLLLYIIYIILIN